MVRVAYILVSVLFFALALALPNFQVDVNFDLAFGITVPLL